MAQFPSSGIRIAALSVALTVCSATLAQPPASLMEQGLASFYDESFNGQVAASGEVYDQEQLTAAHRTLPFGTRVLVRRLDSKESIVVRINDRGPFEGSRIIDLSFAAARMLRMIDPGLVPVALEVVGRPVSEVAPPTPETKPIFVVQAGSFRNPENARRTQELMEKKFGAAQVVPRADGAIFMVMVGGASTQADAEELALKVRGTDSVYRSAFVVRTGR